MNLGKTKIQTNSTLTLKSWSEDPKITVAKRQFMQLWDGPEFKNMRSFLTPRAEVMAQRMSWLSYLRLTNGPKNN